MVEERINGKITLNQPAGHLESGESLIDAIVRETKEETAWDFTPESIIGIYRWIHAPSGDTFMRFCFSGSVINHDPHFKLDDDIENAVWLSHHDLVARKHEFRSPLVQDCLNDYLSGQRYPLTLLHN
jgi:8-oxo-dGTP pyrophosphatase MutT (NUDIX family)